MDSDEIAADAVGSSEIATGAVTTTEILDGTIGNIDLDKGNIPLSGFGDATAAVSLGGQQITNLADPTLAQDAATKNYVDNAIDGENNLLEGHILVGDNSDNESAVDASGNGFMLVGDGVTLNSVDITGDIDVSNTGDAQIQANAVTSAEVALNTLVADDIADGAVTTGEILNETILAEDIATDAVGNLEIASNAVDSDEIAADAVTIVEIGTSGPGDANKVLTTDGSGDPQWEARTNFLADTLGYGRILVGNASGVAEGLVANLNGYMLIGDGTTLTSVDITGDINIQADGISLIQEGAVGSLEIIDESITSSDIGPNAVGTSELANNAVTYGKMQAVSATSRLLGSSDATTAVQEIAIGSGLTMSGSTLFANVSGLANPSATIGLSMIPGTATTAMRSDAAPALSQAIVPTWTGAHTWSVLGTFNAGITAVGAVNINNNAAANTTNIGTGSTTGTVTIGGNAAQQIDIGSGTGVQTLNLGTGAVGSKTINIGTGAVNNNISIGNTTGNTSLILRAGTGNVVIPDAVMLDLSPVNNSSTTEGLKLPQSSNTSAATSEGQIAWDADDDILTVGTGSSTLNIGIPNNMQAFTSSGTWIKPAGVSKVWVKVWGGGGAGKSAAIADYAGGGGGGGAYSEGIVSVSGNVNVIVGTGGSSDGASGTASSFSGVTTISANGGLGATSDTPSLGGTGGTVSGSGTIQVAGGSGGDGRFDSGAGGGSGGGSPFGGAGGPGGVGSGSNPRVNGTNGTFPGGGGGGGSEDSGTFGAGAGGFVIIYW